MADLTKARAALIKALDWARCDQEAICTHPECRQGAHVCGFATREALLREALVSLEATDTAPLAVLSDFLKDTGGHHLLSLAEDPVKELLALREQKWRALELTENFLPGDPAGFSARLDFEGLSTQWNQSTRAGALALVFRGMAEEIEDRAAGERVPVIEDPALPIGTAELRQNGRTLARINNIGTAAPPCGHTRLVPLPVPIDGNVYQCAGCGVPLPF